MKKSLSRESGAKKYDSFLSHPYSFPICETHKRVAKITSNDSLDLNTSLQQENDKNSFLIDKTIKFKEQNACLGKKNAEVKETLNITTSNLDKFKLNLKRTASREKYCLDKIQIQEKEKQIRELEESLQYLQDLLNDNNKEKELIVFDVKSIQYTPKLKRCIYEVLQNQVSASNVSSVINSVLKMVDIRPNKLPSRTSVLDMNIQRLYISHADVFARDEKTVLLTDETSKFGSKFMGYKACDSKGNFWVLGLRDIETKSANDTLKVVNQILSDLDDTSRLDNKETSNNIVSHIVATMSDRAATEVKFNELLTEFRKEILPLTYHNYNTFTAEEKDYIGNLCNFFCGLHALVNFAETAKSCL